MKKSNEIFINQNTPLSLDKTDFLHCGNGIPKEAFLKVGNLELSKNECKASDAVLHDIQVLTKTELRNKYKGEASSHSNMKDRCNKGNGVLDPRFEDFTCFLALMGVRTKSKYTLDRINNQDKNYSPENCRWADKKTQNSNKGNNVFLTYNEVKQTIADWAKQTNQKSSKLYKRHSSGWTDEEIVTGLRNNSIDAIHNNTPWPEDKWIIWERRYQNEIVKKDEYQSRVEYLYAESDKLAEKFKSAAHCSCEMQFPHNFKSEYEIGSDNLGYQLLIRYRYLASTYLEYEKRKKTYLSKFKKLRDLEAKRFVKCFPPPFTINELAKKCTEFESEYNAKKSALNK